MTADLLKDAPPVDEKLNDVTIRNHVLQIAERMEQALGEEHYALIEGCERDWERLPMPDGPLTVGIDGGFARARRNQGHFEVITGKSILAFKRDELEEEQAPDAKCFGFEVVKKPATQPDSGVGRCSLLAYLSDMSRRCAPSAWHSARSRRFFHNLFVQTFDERLKRRL